MKYYTVAEINLGNLIHNLNQIRKKVHPAAVMAVVKADAYGHGAVPVTRRLVAAGVDNFAVARVAEAVELRKAGIDRNILIFGSLFPDEIETGLHYNAQLTVTDQQDVERISRIAKKLGSVAPVHCNVDTGMGRVGLPVKDAEHWIAKTAGNRSLELQGIYTHFATADEGNKAFTYQQLERFNALLTGLLDRGIELPLIHAANSGAILDVPAAGFDMVRAGISLYGHYPSPVTSESIPLKQVMTFKTRVSLVRRLPKGVSVSYGRQYYTPKETSIAVLPAGYADGVPRAFTNSADVLIKGKLYPVVGIVTMDQVMVAVGDDDIQIGDEAIFWGDTPQGSLQATKVAARIGTISYELCCRITKRVPRLYRQ